MLNGNSACGEGNGNRLVANAFCPCMYVCLRVCVVCVCVFLCEHVHRGKYRPFVSKKVLINNAGCF